MDISKYKNASENKVRELIKFYENHQHEEMVVDGACWEYILSKVYIV